MPSLVRIGAALLVTLLLITPVLCTDFPGQVYGPFFVGSKIYVGEGTPSNSMGIDGDMSIDPVSGLIWNKTAGTWTVRGTIMNQTVNLTPGTNLGPAFDYNLSVIAGWILQNRTDILLAEDANNTATKWAVLRLSDDHTLTNVTMLNTTIINMIAGNLTAGGGSGPDGFSNLTTADQHILSNRSLLEGEILSNRSLIEAEIEVNRTEQFIATLLNITKLYTDTRTNDTDYKNQAAIMVGVNISATVKELETQFGLNDTITLNAASIMIDKNITYPINKTIENMIAGNLTAGGGSGPDGFSNLTTADLHILSNRTAIEGEILGNKTVIEGFILGNRTALEAEILSNRSAIEAEIAYNRTLDQISDDYNMSVLDGHIASNLSKAGVNLSSFKGSISNLSIPASSCWGTITNGSTEVAPNKTPFDNLLEIVTLDFPAATTSYGYAAQCPAIRVPGNYASGGFIPTITWSPLQGDAAGTVIWSVDMLCQVDDGALSGVAFGNTTMTDTATAQNDLNVITAAGAITPGGTVAAGGTCFPRVRRIAGTETTAVSFIRLDLAYASN